MIGIQHSPTTEEWDVQTGIDHMFITVEGLDHYSVLLFM